MVNELVGVTEAERELFLEETIEHLQILESGLLKLEQNATDMDTIGEIFRSAHTIKGSAATLGLQDMTDLTHALETWLDKFRNKECQPSPEIIDNLLAAADALKELTSGLTEQVEVNVDITPILRCLDTTRSNGGNGAAELPAQPIPVDAQTVGGRGWQVTALIDDNCPMPAVRALQLLLTLDEVGTVVGSIPDRTQIESEQVQRQITIWVTSDVAEDRVATAVDRVPEISTYDIQPVRGEDSFKGTDKEAVTSDASTVRINISILDELMNLVGELVIGRGRLVTIGETVAEESTNAHTAEELARLSAYLSRVTGSIQDCVLKARMLPLSRVFQRLPRLVRDLARQQGKQVELVIRGGDTELDRSVLELLGDPLMHLVRNSIDHGIELPDDRERSGKSRIGLIEIEARHEESRVVIAITDDGKGLDPHRLKRAAVEKNIIPADLVAELTDRAAYDLIFSPGFSTAVAVTEVSGRGVGMDVVKRNIEQAGGRIEVDSQMGSSTCIRLVLPLTLATLRALLLSAAGQRLAAPLSTVQETLHVDRQAVTSVNKRPHTLVRNNLIPLFWLEDLYDPDPDWTRKLASKNTVVLARHSTGVAGIVVDQLLGEREVVIKRLGEAVGSVPGIGGATILGDGSVALILDVPGAIRTLALQT